MSPRLSFLLAFMSVVGLSLAAQVDEEDHVDKRGKDIGSKIAADQH